MERNFLKHNLKPIRPVSLERKEIRMESPKMQEFSSVHSIALALALSTMGAFALAISPAALADDVIPPPTLPSPLCDNLEVPAGNSVAFHAYAIGTQNYMWSGSNWVFIAPSAILFGDPGYNGEVAIHFAGPTWESNSGSKVVGHKLAACMPDTTAIPWLLLGAVSSQGPGVFDRVTFIQRVNTVGGKAPASSGTFVGQEADVPYTAEYYFYKADETED
jgi:uncharacterized protein DUF3455